jgi:hypothetical protein
MHGEMIYNIKGKEKCRFVDTAHKLCGILGKVHCDYGVKKYIPELSAVSWV